MLFKIYDKVNKTVNNDGLGITFSQTHKLSTLFFYPHFISFPFLSLLPQVLAPSVRPIPAGDKGPEKHLCIKNSSFIPAPDRAMKTNSAGMVSASPSSPFHPSLFLSPSLRSPLSYRVLLPLPSLLPRHVLPMSPPSSRIP